MLPMIHLQTKKQQSTMKNEFIYLGSSMVSVRQIVACDPRNNAKGTVVHVMQGSEPAEYHVSETMEEVRDLLLQCGIGIAGSYTNVRDRVDAHK